MKRHPVKDSSGKFKRSYRKWSSMVRRCSDPLHPVAKYYVLKGISVCDRWLGTQGYSNFLDDMGEPPDGLTLERIDNSKGYSPDNCRWASWKEQANNRIQGGRTNIIPSSLRQKALSANLPYNVVYIRIHRLHWPEDKALSTPVLPRCKSAYTLFLERSAIRLQNTTSNTPTE